MQHNNNFCNPPQYKMAATNALCKRLNNCIQEESIGKKEISRIQLKIENKDYNVNVVSKTLAKMKEKRAQ